MKRILLMVLGCVALATGCSSSRMSSVDPGWMKAYEEKQRQVVEEPQPEPTPERATLAISLEKCLELALKADYEVQLGALGPKQRAEDFLVAGEKFAPAAWADVSTGRDRYPSTSFFGGAPVIREDDVSGEAGITKTWGIGLRTDLVWAYDRFETNSSFSNVNPQHESRLSLAFEQPLIQGFGVGVNEAELRRAVNDRKIAVADFEMVLESELLRTYRAYWTLVLAAEELAVQEASLRLAAEQVEISQDLLAAGSVAQLEVTGAQAALARQEEAVISARNAYQKAGDQLLRIIRPRTNPDEFDLAVVATTRPDLEDQLPELSPVEPLAKAALRDRPEIRRANLSWDNARIDVQLADDLNYTNLDLYGEAGTRGIESSFRQAGDQLNDGDFSDWEIGVRLSFLLDGRSRDAQWRKAVLSERDAVIRKGRAATEVILQVRTAWFDLNAAREQFEATRRTVTLAREQYEGEVDRQRAGRSTQFRVERLRRDLLDAEKNFLRARIGVYVSRAVLETARGQFASSILATR